MKTMTSQKSSDEVDLTIEYRGRIFQAHRIMVCRKSEVLKKALVGNFVEANNQKLELPEDDSETVERMLVFCYTDDYDDGSNSANEAGHQSLISAMSQIQFEANAASSATIEEQGQDSNTMLPTNDLLGGNDTQESAADNLTWKGLMNNALVYSIADKYAIHSLKALAKKKFTALTEKSLPCDFSRIVREVFDSTPARDNGLRNLLVDKCMAHLDVLLQEEAFEALLHEKAELGCALLKQQYEKHSKLSGYVNDLVECYKTKIDEQNRELELIRHHRDRLQLLLDNREKTLNNTRNCRHCGSDFNCVFRTGESFLRCSTCSTKHYL